jgi:quercetin dioxygenase-like cupin family protein
VKVALVSVLLAGVVAASALQDPVKPAPQAPPKDTVTIVKAANVKWVDHPSLPGAKMAIETGDPAKGPAVFMLKFPKGMTIPAHWHSAMETATIVSGFAVFGTGETVDAAKGTEVGVGSYMNIPAKSPHWAIAKEDLIVTVATDKATDFHLCGEKQ